MEWEMRPMKGVDANIEGVVKEDLSTPPFCHLSFNIPITFFPPISLPLLFLTLLASLSMYPFDHL
jgi:hypothetical protein